MKHAACKRRRGLSLLEMVIASSMLALLLTSMSVVLRTGRQAWEAHEADYIRIEALHSTLRHIVRQIRAADAVTAISASNVNNGSLSLRMDDGSIQAWLRDNSNNVWSGITTANQLLGTGITQLRFEGLRADGVTPTTTVSQIQCIRVTAQVQLPRETGGAKSASSLAWIRSW
jgi:type II secretory pathway pseudopilin PulG